MKFYVMHSEVGVPNETWCSYLKPEHEAAAPRCPVCSTCIGPIRTLPPYGIELLVRGKAPGDLAFTPSNAVVVSSHFHAGWEKAQLRGLEFMPVERIRIRPARLGKKPYTYFHAEVQRFGTRIDLHQSLIEYSRPITCPQCYASGIDTIRGFAIDEASWTGEDIFLAWGLNGSIIVTERVRQLRDDHDLKNISLTPTEEFFWDPYNQWSVIDYSNEARDKYEYVTEEDPPTN